MNWYSIEQQYAFFPGYPMVVRQFSKLFFSGLCRRSAMCLSGILISNISFIISALLLYRLSRAQKFTPHQSRIASIMFCINPASVFMSSMYTESLFSLTSFYGFLKLSQSNLLLASLSFAFATLTRSNGVLYAGFFIWKMISSKGKFSSRIMTIISSLLYTIITILPFITFQFMGKIQFCKNINSNIRHWCNNSIPLIYSHVQSHYWNNGFLKYYTISQIPNFILATPMFLLISKAILKYAKFEILRFISIGFKTQVKKIFIGEEYYSYELLPFVYLNLVMLIIVTLFMHVQVIFIFKFKVIVRFFASSPLVYWFLAFEISSHKEETFAKWYIKYSVVYGSIGIVLFANFLPPA